ncbi:putative acyltransferase YihG [Pseudoalteromonas sp. P1-9]|uniref:acyltransferase n=1 Tax=Pseudoalteromonas sp. P1-9 TaxID=1710354 RepID=UPI0006D61B34|nr:acyltransferase [Pseudoalteromonas sp. P1-9]KPV98113.1 putative acyltransferase YihG [Pseudoalteromonas sp. P1-9]
MLSRFLPGVLLAPIIFTILVCNVVLWGGVIFVIGLLKIVLPLQIIRDILHIAYAAWCKGNYIGVWLACDNWQVDIEGELDEKAWYLLIANHQSWLDIMVLSGLGRLPAPKFFLKDELKWVPFVGAGAWAMDMPFMKRVSKAKVAKNPKLKGMDVERTKRACRHFRLNPTTIINFVEGSRYTETKHKQQRSPFKYLLKPKAGGIAFALEVLGEKMDGLLNTSIVYHGTSETICKDMLFGKLTKIHVDIKVQPISAELIGNYQHDREFRVEFQQKLNVIWQDKDLQISLMQENEQLPTIKPAHSS